MKLSERFAAVMIALTASEFTIAEGKPELTEENVAALEAAATELSTARADVETLKGENQAHAETIAQLEADAEASAAVVDTIREALVANNVELAEGADVAAIAAEKINAWGASVPPATPVSPTDGDDLGDGKDEAFLTEIDKRARAKRSKK